MTPSDFWAQVTKPDGDEGCWIWTGKKTPKGYGVCAKGRAYLYSYTVVVGPVQRGLHLDHLCRNRACVNPAHLEPVTCRENLLRGDTIAAANAAKTHCSLGHEFTAENTQITKKGQRRCRACSRYYERRRRAYLSGQPSPVP